MIIPDIIIESFYQSRVVLLHPADVRNWLLRIANMGEKLLVTLKNSVLFLSNEIQSLMNIRYYLRLVQLTSRFGECRIPFAGDTAKYRYGLQLSASIETLIPNSGYCFPLIGRGNRQCCRCECEAR